MTDFFEQFYARVGQDFEQIPWARLAPREFVVEWLDLHPPQPQARALVIACGLGDDAEELARRGCDVDAFDISPTAIANAQRRFPESRVRYRVADVFDLPEEWHHRFEIVVEVQTVQSLPPDTHRRSIEAIADTVADGGHLLVRAAVLDEPEPDGPPWPLQPHELGWFEEAGLREMERVVEDDGVFIHLDYRR